MKAVQIELKPYKEPCISCAYFHLLYGMCVKIFIMNRYISKSYMTTNNYWPTIYRQGTAVLSTITTYYNI